MQSWGNQCQESQNRRVSYNAPPLDVTIKGSENFSRKFSSRTYSETGKHWPQLKDMDVGTLYKEMFSLSRLIAKARCVGSSWKNCSVFVGNGQQIVHFHDDELPGLNSPLYLLHPSPHPNILPISFHFPPIQLPLFPWGTVSGTYVISMCVLRGWTRESLTWRWSRLARTQWGKAGHKLIKHFLSEICKQSKNV
jgi:hypothetical protein